MLAEQGEGASSVIGASTLPDEKVIDNRYFFFMFGVYGIGTHVFYPIPNRILT